VSNSKLAKKKAFMELRYSAIIDPERYNQIISHEHIYISQADNYLAMFISNESRNNKLEVVEVGCGPARILPLIKGSNKNIILTGIDVDSHFIAYAKNVIQGLNISLIRADARSYQHDTSVSIFYSQGFHHHVSNLHDRMAYLKNIYSQLKAGGYYLISDEFIANYTTETERITRLVIWYSHVIAHAIQKGYNYLAQEESKTLLDDIYERDDRKVFKTANQIELILANAIEIDQLALNGEFYHAEKLSNELILNLHQMEGVEPIGSNELDISRGDYKICDRVFRQEVQEVGFIVEDIKSFGPFPEIGGMCIYILKKQKNEK
jgi:SAM-dependent methyltransferase